MRRIVVVIGAWLLPLALVLASEAQAQTLAYDTVDRLIQVRYDGTRLITCGYDANGYITNMTFTGNMPEEDADSDSMPDAWEWVYFNNLTNSATADPNQNGKNNLWEYQNGYDPLDPDSDGDGALNWDELAAGTDALDPLSVFQVSGVRFQVSGPVVEWSSATSKRYRIQRSAHLPGGFGNLLTNILATPPLNVHTDETAVGFGPWIYRVELE